MPANTWRKMPAFYNLLGSKCECGKVYFPARHVCAECGSKEMTEHAFNGKGKIATYTTIRQQFNDEGESEKLVASSPYVIAIIELEEGPMVTAQVTDCDPSSLQIGQKVRSVFRKIGEEGEDGLIRYGYKFVLG